MEGAVKNVAWYIKQVLWLAFSLLCLAGMAFSALRWPLGLPIIVVLFTLVVLLTHKWHRHEKK